MKISAYWLIPVLVIGVLAAWLYLSFVYEPKGTVSIRKRPVNDIITLKLPHSPDTEVFGPKYWEAFHALAEMIPCTACKNGAMHLEIFKHDIVNLHLGKKVFDKSNWDKMYAMVTELNKKA